MVMAKSEHLSISEQHNSLAEQHNSMAEQPEEIGRKRRRQDEDIVKDPATEPSTENKPITTVRHPTILQPNELYDTTLASWLKEQGASMVKVEVYSVDWMYAPVHWVKKAIRSFLALVLDMKKKGFSLGENAFKIENIVISYNSPKLIDPNLKSFNPEFTKANISQLRELLLSAFFNEFSLNDIPCDMWALLELMVDSKESNEYLMMYNFALMNGKGKAGFITQCHNMSFGYNQEKMNKHMKVGIALKPTEPWKVAFKGISAFEQLYERATYKDTGEDLLRFFRNCIPHLIEHAWEFKEQSGDDPNYGYEDAINMLSAVYPLQLSQIQGLLHENALLKSMNPEGFFYE